MFMELIGEVGLEADQWRGFGQGRLEDAYQVLYCRQGEFSQYGWEKSFAIAGYLK